MTLLAAAFASGALADPFSDLGIPAAPPWEAPSARQDSKTDAARPLGPDGSYERALASRLEADLSDALAWRGELESVLRYASSRPQVFPKAAVERRELFDEYRAEAEAAWARALDLTIALDRLAALYGPARASSDPAARRLAQAMTALALAAQARFALSWSVYPERDAALKDLFDAPRPGLGLSGGAWSRLAARFTGAAGRRGADAARAAWDSGGGV
ncbi:MAG: hypothetical protein HY928_09500, partial [Elusimicrobia bacterium]|nr:hypothetical protein [Elusimicrobiota bacterium]